MAYIELSKINKSDLIIMIFVEGTILKPKSVLSLYNHKSYVPIGNCVSIIRDWQEQGAQIVYCTSRKGKKAKDIACLLVKYGFVGTKIYFRDNEFKKYNNIVEFIKPSILIEDDCKSIGGAWQMCITNVETSLKKQIKSIVVKEFKGIDHLSKNIN